MDRHLTSDDIPGACATGAARANTRMEHTMLRKHLVAGLTLGVLALVVWGCSDAGPTAPAGSVAAPSFSVSSGNPDLVICKTKRSTSVSQRIGSKGGMLTLNGHTLVIPPYALSSTVTITLSQEKGINSEVDLQPQGLQFAVPASLTLDYSDCTIPPSAAFVAYLNPNGTAEPLPSEDLRDLLKVTAPLAHFSQYAVAW